MRGEHVRHEQTCSKLKKDSSLYGRKSWDPRPYSCQSASILYGMVTASSHILLSGYSAMHCKVSDTHLNRQVDQTRFDPSLQDNLSLVQAIVGCSTISSSIHGQQLMPQKRRHTAWAVGQQSRCNSQLRKRKVYAFQRS